MPSLTCSQCRRTKGTDRTHVGTTPIGAWFASRGNLCTPCFEGRSERFGPDTPLSAVREYVESCLYGEPSHCPGCSQDVKSRSETLYASCVRCLAIIYSLGGTTEPVSLPRVRAEQRRITGVDGQERNDWTKNINRLRFWELATPIDGEWRCEPLGEDFLHGRVAIRKIALTFNSRVLEYRGPDVSVHDALDIHFDLRKFFRGEL